MQEHGGARLRRHRGALCQACSRTPLPQSSSHGCAAATRARARQRVHCGAAAGWAGPIAGARRAASGAAESAASSSCPVRQAGARVKAAGACALRRDCSPPRRGSTLRRSAVADATGYGTATSSTLPVDELHVEGAASVTVLGAEHVGEGHRFAPGHAAGVHRISDLVALGEAELGGGQRDGIAGALQAESARNAANLDSAAKARSGQARKNILHRIDARAASGDSPNGTGSTEHGGMCAAGGAVLGRSARRQRRLQPAVAARVAACSASGPQFACWPSGLGLVVSGVIPEHPGEQGDGRGDRAQPQRCSARPAGPMSLSARRACGAARSLAPSSSARTSLMICPVCWLSDWATKRRSSIP